MIFTTKKQLAQMRYRLREGRADGYSPIDTLIEAGANPVEATNAAMQRLTERQAEGWEWVADREQPMMWILSKDVQTGAFVRHVQLRLTLESYHAPWVAN